MKKTFILKFVNLATIVSLCYIECFPLHVVGLSFMLSLLIVQFMAFNMALTHLLYRADGDTRSTGHDEVAVFDIWPDLIQHEGNDVRLHGQKQNITFADRLFVAGGEVDTQFLDIKKRQMCNVSHTEKRRAVQTPVPLTPSVMGLGGSDCTHPQSLHRGEISVRGAGRDFVGGDHTLKFRGAGHNCSKFTSRLESTCLNNSKLNRFDAKLTCGSEASNQGLGRLARSYKAHTHPTCVDETFNFAHTESTPAREPNLTSGFSLVRQLSSRCAEDVNKRRNRNQKHQVIVLHIIDKNTHFRTTAVSTKLESWSAGAASASSSKDITLSTWLVSRVPVPGEGRLIDRWES